MLDKEKDILIVGQDTVGILDIILEGISQYTSFTYSYFNFELIWKKFHYRNTWHRIENFISKNTAGINMKKQFYEEQVINHLNQLQSRYKMIFVIRPDLLSNNHLQLLKSKTKCLVAYYWDPVEFFPRKLDIRNYFNKIFSFNPPDCEKYGFEFIPNFYFVDSTNAAINYEVYNLGSMDSRRPVLEAVAKELDKMNISYLFKGYDGKPFVNKYIKHTFLVPYKEMLKEISHCNVLLDIQKKGQEGLTFRPFEAMGMNKKLITTNSNITQYDFYNLSNISILDPENVRIDKEFFQTPYVPVPSGVKEKYHLKNWINKVFSF
jgi:hypothetical protein